MGLQATIVCDTTGCTNQIGPVGGVSETAQERVLEQARQASWLLTLGQTKCPQCRDSDTTEGFWSAVKQVRL